MYLDNIVKTKHKFVDFACLPDSAPKLHPDAHSFEINGHQAAV